MRRRESNHNGTVIQILLILSIIVGLTMTSLGVIFRVYVCHWVAKVLFACWIGVFVSVEGVYFPFIIIFQIYSVLLVINSIKQI